ncbi:hypothetical protein RUM43_000255 [Polyplax serrata]|uniref:Uncharacterized protein n=1 Tax=Polyplax serrata TaxID=468196 RepID=A0AAN8XNS0_POLSC
MSGECLVVALFGCAVAEPPSGYNYNRPSGGFGGGFSGGFGGGHSSGGSYQQVAPGPQTNEGQNLDYALLEQIKQVLLRDEASSGGSHGAPSSSYGAPSSSYGAPSSSYGVPSSGRVVGLDLEGVQQALQVAQFSQQSFASGGGYPSSSYGAPSRAPSGSYGAPY